MMRIQHRQLVLLFLLATALWVVAAALPVLVEETAADSSVPVFYEYDNQVYYGGALGVAWRNFDMFFYQSKIFKAYLDLHHNNRIAFYSHDPADSPLQSPDLITVLDPDTLDQPQPQDLEDFDSFRFCIFDGALYLFYGRTTSYAPDYSTYHQLLCYRKLIKTDPVWTWSEETILWRHDTSSVTRPIIGLVAKVINGYVCLLVQHTQNPLLVFKFDGQKLTNYDSSSTNYNINGNDALTQFPINAAYYYQMVLNGDVIVNLSDDDQTERENVAFVAKDDVLLYDEEGEKAIQGNCYLYVYDPAGSDKGTLTRVARLPGQWKDLAVAQGDVYGCTPYSFNSLEIWGLPWGGSDVQHIRFVFNDDGKSGTFEPDSWTDLTNTIPDAKNSGRLQNTDRGALQACASATQLDDDNGKNLGMQQNIWVWWYGSTSASYQHGRSLKYMSDFLKLEDTYSEDTSSYDDINDAWTLLGVVMGLPPFYTNGHEFDDSEWTEFNAVSFGQEIETSVSSTVTQSASLSFSYEREGILKASHVDGRFGVSYSTSIENSRKQDTSQTVETTLTYSPAFYSNPDYAPGSQAWALFYAPTICNDVYRVWSPDQAQDLGFSTYYTYVSEANVISSAFDLTNPGGRPGDFFNGIAPMPSSLDYVGWNHKDLQRSTSTDTYDILDSTGWECDGNASEHTFKQGKITDSEQRNVNSLEIKGGALGFQSQMSGEIKFSSSVEADFSQYFSIVYGIRNALDSDPLDLEKINMYAYLLTAKTTDAFWIPSACKVATNTQYPWCITWYVNSYQNADTMEVTVGSGPESVSKALEAPGGEKVLSIVLRGSTSESAPLLLDNRSVILQGHPSTLSANGKPQVLLSVPNITIGKGASLSLKNVILSNGGGAAPIIYNQGSLSLRNCVLLGGGSHGIVQDGGSLFMEKSIAMDNLGDGMQLHASQACLENSEIINNSGIGLSVEDSLVDSVHCALLNNRGGDLLSSPSSDMRVTNSVFGSILANSTIATLSNSLVENRDVPLNIDEEKDTLSNVPAGYFFKCGLPVQLRADSPCIDAGRTGVPVNGDIDGDFRDALPDIGPLERALPVEVEALPLLRLKTYMGPDPELHRDELEFNMTMKVPEGFFLEREGEYLISFGGLRISSKEFPMSFMNPEEPLSWLRRHHPGRRWRETTLLFVDDAGSSLWWRHDPGRNLLELSVHLRSRRFYEELSAAVNNSQLDAQQTEWRVYLPLRIAVRGLYQTGETMASFLFTPHRLFGYGRAPVIEPERTFREELVSTR